MSENPAVGSSSKLLPFHGKTTSTDIPETFTKCTAPPIVHSYPAADAKSVGSHGKSSVLITSEDAASKSPCTGTPHLTYQSQK